MRLSEAPPETRCRRNVGGVDRIVRAHEADGAFAAFGEAWQVRNHVLRVEWLAE